MHTYAATYIPGLGEIITKALQTDIPDLELLRGDDGLILFKTTQSYESLLQITYLNNVYSVFFYDPSMGKDKSPHGVVKTITQKAHFSRIPGRTFRLMVLQGSQLVHVTREITNALKDKIIKQTGAQFSPLKADIEFWVMIRNNGTVFIGYKKQESRASVSTQKGELKSEIAELIVRASNPDAGDIFLDPFAGYGSLPYARMFLEPYKKIILCDKDSRMVEGLKQRFKKYQNIDIHKTDARSLGFLGDNSINSIVTDPPWGKYEDISDVPVFYAQILKELSRVLVQNGTLVLLSAEPEALQVAMEDIPALILKKHYTTLVNGKKASLFVIEKAEQKLPELESLPA